MPTIAIVRKAGASNTGFAAGLHIDGGKAYQVTITNPFRKKQEDELEQYFEKWLKFPYADTAAADRAANSIKAYGVHLFNQVFASEESQNVYAKLKDELSEVFIEIVSDSPDFHALHWEALWDPDQPRPLAVDCSLVRRPLEQKATETLPLLPIEPSPVINLLLVVARPEGEWDVGYRTVSRPVVEAVQASKLRVNVDLLRPGTFEALSKQLEAKGPGYYHIVHFDCHGELMDYERAREVLKYQQEDLDYRYGRKRLKSYRGLRAFLKLEGPRVGSVDLVKAPEIAKLLVAQNVPICILNACQSGKQVLPDTISPEEPVANSAYDTSLASCLLKKGLRVVVAMAYTVTVSAAQILMKELYSQLCAQKSVLESLQLGRLQLYNNKMRRAHHKVTIALEDWMLPVVYASQSVDLRLCEFEDTKEREEYSASLSSTCCFTAPSQDFVGRDLDILKIETALMHHSTLLLRGMGGTGKTTLLRYLCNWWQLTRFAAKVLYFGYDEHAWTLRQILMVIVTQVCDKRQQHKLQPLSDDALLAKVVARLSGSHVVLILDNLESVASKEQSTMNTLPLDEQQRLCDFLCRLKGHIKVVLGSRSKVNWLANVFGNNVHHLRGLDDESRYVLAQNILKRSVHDESRVAELNKDVNFHHLLKILAGYPLAMEVILANLERQTPRQILAGLDEANVHLDTGSDDKDSSILRCVEYSFNALCPDVQHLLVCLAPFQVVLVRMTVHFYVKELQKLGQVKTFNFSRIDDTVQGAINWGLLSPLNPLGSNDGELNVVNMQPVFPYFLKMKLRGLDDEVCKAMRTGFKMACRKAATAYWYLMRSKIAEERAAGLQLCQLEYENLHSALVMCLEDTEGTQIRLCLNHYFEMKGDFQSGLELVLLVIKGQNAYPSQCRTEEMETELQEAQFCLGNIYCKLNDYKKAKEAYLTVSTMLHSTNGPQMKNKRGLGVIHHSLGMAAEGLREFNEARQHYQEALSIFIEVDDRDSQASTYHQMGMLAHAMRQFAEAHQNYQRALGIRALLGDCYSQGHTLHQLGIVAQQLANFGKAHQHYQRALGIWIQFGDRRAQAITCHRMGVLAQQTGDLIGARQYYELAHNIFVQLDEPRFLTETYYQSGMVAEEQRDFVQAHQSYQRALDIAIEFDDCLAQANIYHQMGMVAQESRDFMQAYQHYQRALDIKVQLDDRHSQARTYHEMGIVAQELRGFAEARQNYQRALDINTQLGDRHSQALNYHQMGMLAQEMRDFTEARQRYQQALDILIEFDDHAQARTYHQMGVLAEELGDFAEARTKHQRALHVWTQAHDINVQAITYHQMGKVAQKSGDFVEARQNYQRALDIKVQSGDLHSQGRTYHEMGMVAQELGEFLEARQNYQQAIDIFIEFDDRSQGSTYLQMGMMAKDLGDFVEACQNYQQACEAFIKYGDRQGQAKSYCALGMLYSGQEMYEIAEENMRKGLAIFTEVGDKDRTMVFTQLLNQIASRRSGEL